MDNKYLEIEKSILYQINNNSTPKYIYGEYLKQREGKEIIINQALKFKKYKMKILITKLIQEINFVCTNTFKFINFNNQIKEFYNIKKDPFEQHNIYNINDENFHLVNSFLKDTVKKIKNSNELKDKLTDKEKILLKRKIKHLKEEKL